MFSSSTEKLDVELNKKPPPNNRVSLRNAFALVTEIVTHMCVATVAFMCVTYAINVETNVSQKLHISLCVCGYQFLMSEAILLKSEGASWSDVLTGKQRRTLHWILQIVGSGMAIAGTFIRINLNPMHFFTMHGIFGLVALVCTTVSLVNGLASLYAYELRGMCSGMLSKITHILLGSSALLFATVSLCYGFQTPGYFNWYHDGTSNALIILTSLSTALVLLRPLINLSSKFMAIFS